MDTLLEILRTEDGGDSKTAAATELLELGTEQFSSVFAMALVQVFRESPPDTKNHVAWLLGNLAKRGKARELTKAGAIKVVVEHIRTAKGIKEFGLPLAALDNFLLADKETAINVGKEVGDYLGGSLDEVVWFLLFFKHTDEFRGLILRGGDEMKELTFKSKNAKELFESMKKMKPDPYCQSLKCHHCHELLASWRTGKYNCPGCGHEQEIPSLGENLLLQLEERDSASHDEDTPSKKE